MTPTDVEAQHQGPSLCRAADESTGTERPTQAARRSSPVAPVEQVLHTVLVNPRHHWLDLTVHLDVVNEVTELRLCHERKHICQRMRPHVGRVQQHASERNRGRSRSPTHTAHARHHGPGHGQNASRDPMFTTRRNVRDRYSFAPIAFRRAR